MERKRAPLALTWIVVSLAAVAAQEQSRPGDRVVLLARPFPLTAVRLLDGPFKDAMLRDQAYLLELDQDRLLHTFRLTAGLPTTATPLGGWEAPDVELRGHTAGHYLSAVALMYAATGDPRFKQRGDAMVAELAKIQIALAAKGFHPGYLSAFPEELIDRVEARQRVWAPYYTLHKMLAGLLDMYQLCDNQQALDVLLKQVAWVRMRMDRLTPAAQQAMLQTEFGGMNDVLASLYGVTGDPEHLRLARAFDHAAVFDPLAAKTDALDGLHANTQIPKIIGAAREYEVTGDTRYRDIATYFWDRVARHRSYANGGHSDGEIFFPVDRFEKHLGGESSETCNTYNMLKLTRHLFAWSPSATTMDFYERGLYNHILASQDPASGGVIYYCPLKPGAWKSYSTKDRSFWCCVGTGLENHAKYADTIYFHDTGALFVNLFIPSELTWKDQGLVVRQTTRFPEEGRSHLAFTAERPVRLTLRVRHPFWATSGFGVTVNGVSQPIDSTPGSYLSIVREWATGDTVDLILPMSLRTEALPGTTDTVALFYGPVLLAGELGSEGLDAAKRYGPSAPPLSKVPAVEVPALVAPDPGRLLASIVPVPNRPLTFRTAGVGQPRDVTLVPFYQANQTRYSVYWKMYSPSAWDTRKAAEAVPKAAPRVVDSVDLDTPASEQAHGFRGEKTTQPEFEGRIGRETREGWFSYELEVPPDRPVAVAAMYRGGEGRRRVFDVLVDGVTIASETLAYHPTEWLERIYAVPETVTRGKRRVTVRFQPAADALTASVFEVRVVEHRDTP